MSFQEDLEKQSNGNIVKIANYLMDRDDLKDALEKPNKSLKEMWEYIMSVMYKKYVEANGEVNGCEGPEDEEVYQLAVHYYDEDDIKIEKINPQVKVASSTSTSKKADKPKIKKKNSTPEGQMTLFDE